MEHHHHHEHRITSLNGIYITAIVLNLSYVIIEAGIGFWSNSLGLLSDAGHNLSDVFSLLLAMIAFKLSSTRSTRRFTYGYRKSSVLISLLNAIILLIAIGAIIIESIHKFRYPAEVNGSAISWTAGIGILVNGFTAWLLMRQQKHDINTRGAFLHMAADTLVSAGVVVSGIVISLTGFSIIDPVVSLIIAAIILVSTWKLLAESLRMSIDAVPEQIDIDAVQKMMSSVPGVTDVHHLHIWPISTTEIALTAHVVIDDLPKMEEVKGTLKHRLHDAGISHSTLEMETATSRCHEHTC
ncbi:MAG: cation transporter [Bacteroidetes bacterium]|uniref:Cation transporter n=1 Tax=Candidatus Cryptobacteroides merdavium TaxID=2840769 RepID=A0A9D9ED41_9BACT|nr:cation transporter [Candidatus Cryptobacteroides merdavium]